MPLKSRREACGPTHWQLAHDLSISQNCIPGIEAGTRRAWPKLREQLTNYSHVPFEEIFDVALIDPDTNRDRLIGPG